MRRFLSGESGRSANAFSVSEFLTCGAYVSACVQCVYGRMREKERVREKEAGKGRESKGETDGERGGEEREGETDGARGGKEREREGGQERYPNGGVRT